LSASAEKYNPYLVFLFVSVLRINSQVGHSKPTNFQKEA
jgi:hypothetical protein